MKNGHGGNLDVAKQLFPHVTVPWLDLSTGINPFSYPIPSIDTGLYQHLPMQAHEEALKDVAARYYGCINKDYVAIAPGTQILIALMPYVIPVHEVCVLCPTYGEHLFSWQHAGVKLSKIYDLDTFVKCAQKPKRIGVICNPNNPDGRLLSKERLNFILGKWNGMGNYLMIDEAYMDFVNESMVSAFPCDHLIILRSFGKTYGLAGLRVGFLLAQPKIIQKIQYLLGHWCVGGPALHIAMLALQDYQWFTETKQRLCEQQERLNKLLASYKLSCIGGTLLYRLIHYENATSLWYHLASQGIWLRRFDYNHTWLRWGLLYKESDWQRVKMGLSTYFD